MFTEDEVEKLRKAGKIASEVRRWTENFVKEGMKVIEVCEAVEAEIRKRGGEPAFPCNVDINEVGAHYTSPPNDKTVIPKNSIVKVDIGVHVDGYIADTATTICFNYELSNLKEAVEEALTVAVKTVKAGVKVSRIGEVIQATIERYGLKPIRNLTGHEIGRFTIHGGAHIPNVGSLNGYKIEEGKVYAIEPFATTAEGEGEIEENGVGFIYRILKEKPPKSGEEKVLFKKLKENFKTLPFALRWALKVSPTEDFYEVFGRLVKARYVFSYPILVEKRKQPIAQAEHTLIVLRDRVEVTTL